MTTESFGNPLNGDSNGLFSYYTQLIEGGVSGAEISQLLWNMTTMTTEGQIISISLVMVLFQCAGIVTAQNVVSLYSAPDADGEATMLPMKAVCVDRVHPSKSEKDGNTIKSDGDVSEKS